MKLNVLVNRFVIAISTIFSKKNNNKTNNKAILIIFQQIFGDAIVFSSSINEYTKLYPTDKGYKIIMLARPSVAKFMRDVLPIPKEIDLREVDFKKFLEDYSYYKKIKQEYSDIADTVIVPGTSLSGEILASVCTAKRRIGLVTSMPIKWPPIMVLFRKLAYTETVVPTKDHMMLQRHRLLINYLGNKEYKAKLPKLLPQENIVGTKPYAVVCPGASTDVKCWQTDRFAKIIDYITDKYDMDIHLCGGADEEKYEKAILSMVKNKTRVISHVGKTTFKEWSAIVQHAELVVGNDSATLHLAAASNRKAICIAGVYDKYQFFPYKVDELAEGEHLPLTVLEDMPCEWCRTKGYFAGYNNKECQKHIKEKGNALCIDKITVEKVKENIDKLLSSNIM